MQEETEKILKNVEEAFNELIHEIETYYRIPVDPEAEWKCLFDLDYCKIFSCPQYGFWIIYSLTPRLKKYIGQKLTPFNCWKTARLCEGEKLTTNNPPLKRPHLTCVFCYLRKVVNGKAPKAVPITIHITPIHKTPYNWKRRIRSIITKYLCSWADICGS